MRTGHGNWGEGTLPRWAYSAQTARGIAERGEGIPVSRASLATSLPFRPPRAPPARLDLSLRSATLCVPSHVTLICIFPLLAFGNSEPSAREPFLCVRRTERNPTLRDVGRGRYCARRMHAPFALSMPFFAQPLHRPIPL